MTQPLKAHFKHVGLYVTDLEKMANFYQRWFGLVATDGGMGGAGKGIFLSSDPEEHHQIVFVVGRAPETKTTVNQLSFLVDDLKTVKAYYQKAKAENVQITMTKSHGNALSVYIMDPEGNQIEIYCHTPWYVSQPAGKPMNLELSDEDIMAQVQKEVFSDPTYLPRETWMEQISQKMNA